MASKNLIDGNIPKTLLSLTGPMVFGVIAIIAVDLADTLFLGRYGKQELAAISFCFPVLFTIISLVLGLGSGAASVVSRALGRQDLKLAGCYAFHSMIMALALSVILSILGYLTIDILFRAMGATDDILPHINIYMVWWYASFPLVAIPIIINSLLRATGDTKLPALFMASGALINIALNPLLIFGLWGLPELGMLGAALATAAARLCMTIFAVWVFLKKTDLMITGCTTLNGFSTSFRKITHVAIPAAASSMINPFIATIITAMVAEYGVSAVAAWGVAGRIETFALVPLLALSGTIGAFTGQNWGADQFDRVRAGLKWAFLFCVLWAVFCAVFFWLCAPVITAQFNDAPNVIRISTNYLYLVMITTFGYGIVIVASGALNAIGKPLTGMIASVFRTVALYLPLAWLFSQQFGLYGILYGAMSANILGGLIAIILTFRSLK